MKDDEPLSETYKREMYTHLDHLRERCSKLIESGDPLDIFNQVQSIRSIAGQLDAAARRWKTFS